MRVLGDLKRVLDTYLRHRQSGTTTWLRKAAEGQNVLIISPTEASAKHVGVSAVGLGRLPEYAEARRYRALVLDNHTVLDLVGRAVDGLEESEDQRQLAQEANASLLLALQETELRYQQARRSLKRIQAEQEVAVAQIRALQQVLTRQAELFRQCRRWGLFAMLLLLQAFMANLIIQTA